MLSRPFLRKTLFARAAIDISDKRILTRDEFFVLMMNGKYTPEKYRMTEEEATKYLDVLKRSKMVVEANQYIYADPQSAVDAVHLKAGLPLASSLRSDLQQSRHELARSLAESHERTTPIVEEVVRREKEFWALTALGSGIQMLVLSYLTFQVYGWDVMEPVTFFVTTATALCSYAYFLYFRKEHSYEHIDDSLLPYALSKELGRSPAEAEKMIRDFRLSRELEQVASLGDKRMSKLVAESLRR